MNNLLDSLKNRIPVVWIPSRGPVSTSITVDSRVRDELLDAEKRLERFGPLLAMLFPELESSGGIIESPLTPVPSMRRSIESFTGEQLTGSLMVKEDHALPVAGSVKARGGVYEVLYMTEKIAIENGLLEGSDPFTTLAQPRARRVFSNYTFSVGSTGNLGLSIGLTATALGFNCTVHMSSEARQWKKELLRSKGVDVIEHASDYSAAVAEGRRAAEKDPFNHFVDDEQSLLLFAGYGVAAFRLEKQLSGAGITVDRQHPLFVYLPCGVGGAPGGITFGLRMVFGDAVHCFFVEPVESPCVLLSMMNGFSRPAPVYELGLTNSTDADGLAVSTASLPAGRLVKDMVAGCITVPDDDLFRMLYMLYRSENMKIEPSAAAGLFGASTLSSSQEGKRYIENLDLYMKNSTHIAWTTGGSFLPADEFERFLDRGGSLVNMDP